MSSCFLLYVQHSLSKADNLDRGGQGFQSTHDSSDINSQNAASKYTKSDHVFWPGTLWNIRRYKQHRQSVHSKRSTQLMSLKQKPSCLHHIPGTIGEEEFKFNRSFGKKRDKHTLQGQRVGTVHFCLYLTRVFHPGQSFEKGGIK